MILDKLHVGIAVGCLALAGIALHEHDSHVREAAISSAVQQAQQVYQKQLASQMADLEHQSSLRESAYQTQLQVLQKRLGQAATPQQLSELASQVMGLKVPVQILTPAPTAANPNPQPIAEVSLLDAPQVKDYITKCETCNLELPKFQADLAQREAQAKLAQQEIDSLTKQRDAAVTAVKGGNIWQRTTRALKYIGIGAGIGAIAVCGSGHCK